MDFSIPMSSNIMIPGWAIFLLIIVLALVYWFIKQRL